jgi:hypothetical protein
MCVPTRYYVEKGSRVVSSQSSTPTLSVWQHLADRQFVSLASPTLTVMYDHYIPPLEKAVPPRIQDYTPNIQLIFQ